MVELAKALSEGDGKLDSWAVEEVHDGQRGVREGKVER